MHRYKFTTFYVTSVLNKYLKKVYNIKIGIQYKIYSVSKFVIIKKS